MNYIVPYLQQKNPFLNEFTPYSDRSDKRDKSNDRSK